MEGAGWLAQPAFGWLLTPAVFPWLVHALFGEKGIRKRRPKKLLDALPDAVAMLQREVEKRRRELSETLSFPGAGPTHDPANTVR